MGSEVQQQSKKRTCPQRVRAAKRSRVSSPENHGADPDEPVAFLRFAQGSALSTDSGNFHQPRLSLSLDVGTAIRRADSSSRDEDAFSWNERVLDGGLPPFLMVKKALDPQTPALAVDRGSDKPSMDIDLGQEVPDTLLGIFRTEMNDFFPFINIPDHMDADLFHERHPELFVAIMAVTSKFTSQQRSISKSHMERLTIKVMVDGERSLDILLAVLTYLGWCYHHHSDRVCATSLCTLPRILVAGLKLDQKCFENSGKHQKIDQLSKEAASAVSMRSYDEHRALMCFWYLTSLMPNMFQHGVDIVRWTPCFEKSYQFLLASHDRRDQRAAALTEIQRVTQRIKKLGPSTSMDHFLLYIRLSQKQLAELGAKLGSDIDKDPAITWAYRHAEISFYKIGLFKLPKTPEMPLHDFDRIRYLNTCLQAVKSFFDMVFALPEFTGFSRPIAIYKNCGLEILQMLTTFEHPDWDIQKAKSIISFPDILGKLSYKYQQVKTTLALDPHTHTAEDVFSKHARDLACMKAAAEGQETISDLHNDQQDPNIDPTLGRDMSFMDDEWLLDLVEFDREGTGN